MEIVVNSLVETQAFAKRLAQYAQGNFLLCLEGDLGAGKTTFTKAFGKALGITSVINSPTFTILKQYEKLNHIDAYRLENVQQELGFEELFDLDVPCIVEWAQFIEPFLPKERLTMYIEFLDEEKRIFKLQAVGKKYEAILEGLQ